MELISITKPYRVNKSSLVIIIPKEAVEKLGLDKKPKMVCKIDGNILIYEKCP